MDRKSGVMPVVTAPHRAVTKRRRLSVGMAPFFAWKRASSCAAHFSGADGVRLSGWPLTSSRTTSPHGDGSSYAAASLAACASKVHVSTATSSIPKTSARGTWLGMRAISSRLGKTTAGLDGGAAPPSTQPTHARPSQAPAATTVVPLMGAALDGLRRSVEEQARRTNG